ncbi:MULTISPECIES: PilZ domain-containing protein [unclassified Polaromonas]|uniref:PilZ domain-containing protein n=1 Tax=unclassified Polaromonas TaxID=2638319 RepID=UPI001A3008F8|nr:MULTISPECIES: PilZ domain-containing protein [unclassified Polaromonas]MBG6073197.1 type IV pilus assembly protein PilZ [Polaromonas sp. CG_9.7]MBG6115201.1 type IV pilus assembly protein PilZ [Polaromonas sp. CG_9.2]MDH6185030.1 type IV pilus assembly protein PilZ [Polaromonas sp. CG_23.6]
MSTKSISGPATTASRPSIIQLSIKEKSDLYTAYIPLFKEGGIFIATTRDYKLGDDVYVLLTLPDETQRHPITGKVAWITPPHAAGNQTQGIGVRFPVEEKSRTLKAKIEELLGPNVGASRATDTI